MKRFAHDLLAFPNLQDAVLYDGCLDVIGVSKGARIEFASKRNSVYMPYGDGSWVWNEDFKYDWKEKMEGIDELVLGLWRQIKDDADGLLNPIQLTTCDFRFEDPKERFRRVLMSKLKYHRHSIGHTFGMIWSFGNSRKESDNQASKTQ